MDTNSWLRLAAQDPRHRLPPALAAQDPRAARDCGWVEQMTPFITRYLPAGEWVLDPFCGFGSTLVAAAIAGVPAVGVELDAARVALTRARLDALALDARRYPVVCGNVASPKGQSACVAAVGAPGRIGLCLTNIPYFGCDPDAGQDVAQLYEARSYAPYLEQLRQVFEGVHEVLAPGGWCIVMAQNLRLGTRFVPLAWDVARMLGERFVLHEERILIYDRASDPARLGPGGPSATNRAHEYALVCRKQPRGLDVGAGRALLRALQEAGFAHVLHGSFHAYLERANTGVAGQAGDRLPDDIDILVPPDDAEVSRLMQWLEQRGFGIESWNARVHPPMATAALAYRHYFRARRVDARGGEMQVDVTVPESRAAYDAARERYR